MSSRPSRPRPRSIRSGLLAPLFLLAACGGPEPPPEAVSPTPELAAPGRIAGHAIFADGRRGPAAIDMSADPACGELHDHPVAIRDLLVDERGRIENVLVHLAAGLGERTWKPPAEPRLLDQVGCLFVPRVQGLRAGQPIVVRNSDPTLHNVNAQPAHNPTFNFGQPFQGMEMPLVFERPEEVFRLRCDTHPWMAAYLAVFDHPFYAVTGAGGEFTLTEVPPGDYTLRAWHETLGSLDLPVRVTSGETTELAVRFEPEPGADG